MAFQLQLEKCVGVCWVDKQQLGKVWEGKCAPDARIGLEAWAHSHITQDLFHWDENHCCEWKDFGPVEENVWDRNEWKIWKCDARIRLCDLAKNKQHGLLISFAQQEEKEHFLRWKEYPLGLFGLEVLSLTSCMNGLLAFCTNRLKWICLWLSSLKMAKFLVGNLRFPKTGRRAVIIIKWP